MDIITKTNLQNRIEELKLECIRNEIPIKDLVSTFIQEFSSECNSYYEKNGWEHKKYCWCGLCECDE